MENKSLTNKWTENNRNKRFQLFTSSNNPNIPSNGIMWIVRGFGSGWFLFHKGRWYQHWFILPMLNPIDGVMESLSKIFEFNYQGNKVKEKAILDAMVDDLVKTIDLLHKENSSWQRRLREIKKQQKEKVAINETQTNEKLTTSNI